MNRSLVKIILGIFFIGAGIFGYLTKTGGLQLLAIVIGVYGVWNVAWGVYLKNKGENSQEEEI